VAGLAELGRAASAMGGYDLSGAGAASRA
jgi:hypothetical protein